MIDIEKASEFIQTHARELERVASWIPESGAMPVAAEQLEDGGWDVDWLPSSPAAALEWRGYATVRAVTILTGKHG